VAELLQNWLYQNLQNALTPLLVALAQGFSTGVPREIVTEKKTSFFELGQNKQIHRKLSFSTQNSIDNYYWIIISTTY
jgi:hypothetical protein